MIELNEYRDGQPVKKLRDRPNNATLIASLKELHKPTGLRVPTSKKKEVERPLKSWDSLPAFMFR